MTSLASFLTGQRGSALVPLILVGIVALMVVPLPALLLDILLAVSIILSLADPDDLVVHPPRAPLEFSSVFRPFSCSSGRCCGCR
jgi:flagellar biosynthesis component FlhA